MDNLLKDLSASAKKILIISHINADPDAIGSSIAVYEYLKSKGLEPTMGAAGGINALARNLIKKLKYKVEVNPDVKDYDALLILDSSSLSQVSPISVKSFQGLLYVIDHHAHDSSFDELCYKIVTDDSSTSTSEMVYQLLVDADFVFSLDVCLALITGIVTDTAHLQFARPVTFRIIAELLEKSKMEYPDVLRFISIPTEPSRKIAHLKAASRLEIERLDEWIIAKSYVSSFEASAARALVKIGADVSFVVSKKKDELRVAMRANNLFVKKTGINFAKEIVPELSKRFGGSGGGHLAAASVNGTFKGDEVEVLNVCSDVLRNLLNKKMQLNNSQK